MSRKMQIQQYMMRKAVMSHRDLSMCIHMVVLVWMSMQPHQEDYEKIGHFFAKEGTTSWHCSILTDTEEQTDWCIKEAVKHYETNTAAGQPHGNCADLMGIHLEGPFLASEYKGAMPEYLLRTADMPLLKHYQETAGGFIHYITVSPEVAGIPEHVKDITEMGIKVAIGHSGAGLCHILEMYRCRCSSRNPYI